MQRQFDAVLRGLLNESIPTPPSDTGIKLLLAVSGGVDSICMAELFLHSSVDVEFALAHCNFHLRGEESDGDEALVTGWAGTNGVKLHRTDFDTLAYSHGNSVSVEMAARELRYRWFSQLCGENGYAAVCVAHNANDNAETLLLNLVRGTGMRGLAGIREVSPIPFVEKGVVIRPLLGFTRKQIEGYAMSHGIRWREDSTNASDDYKRNRVRNSVFPILESLNPSFVKTFNREMDYFAEAGDIVDDYCRRQAEGVTDICDGILKVNVSGLLASGHWRSVLYYILEPYGFNSSVAASLSELLVSGRTIAGKTFVSDTHELLTSSDWLIVRKHAESGVPVRNFRHGFHSLPSSGPYAATSLDSPAMVVHGAGNYRFNGVSFAVEVEERTEDMSLKTPSGTIIFDADRLSFPFVCRRWMKGDWFRPLGLRGKKKVSDLFTDLKYNLLEKETAIMVVAPGIRTQVREGVSEDFLHHDETSEANAHISAVLGVRIDDSLKVTSSTRRIVRMSLMRSVPENAAKL